MTGSNSGTGFWCAKALVKNRRYGGIGVSEFGKSQCGQGRNTPRRQKDAKLVVLQLDTSQLSSVRAFAAAFQEKFQRLDWLVNNAGVMALNYSKTQDGHEIQWQTNHLGHFLLTKLLWKTIMASPGETRIVQHSSSMHAIYWRSQI